MAAATHPQKFSNIPIGQKSKAGPASLISRRWCDLRQSRACSQGESDWVSGRPAPDLCGVLRDQPGFGDPSVTIPHSSFSNPPHCPASRHHGMMFISAVSQLVFVSLLYNNNKKKFPLGGGEESAGVLIISPPGDDGTQNM